MAGTVSIELNDFDAIQAALDNVGPLHELLGFGGATGYQATALGLVSSQTVIQTRPTASPVPCVKTTTDNCLNYPMPSEHVRVISTSASSVLQRHYCTHVHVAESYFGHLHSDWYSRLDNVLVNLGRLQSGWWGAESKPPRISACRDLEQVGSYLPSHTKQPEVEVDESTGSVSLIWSQQSPAASVTLVFTGDGTVIGVVIGHSFKARWKHSVTNDRAILNALSVATAKVVLFTK